MKKVYFILFFVFCLFVIALQAIAKKGTIDNWQQISDFIYIYNDSVSINEHGYISAWFKIYDSEEHKLYDVDGVPVFYEFVKYEADCVDDVLALIHTISFDKNGIPLKNEPNTYNVFSSHSGVIDGDIYYNALCKYKKDDK